MNIKFLGTAAAEGWPALFCECLYCTRARALGGKNIRTRSSCLIDDKYMVDFPPDTYMHVLNNKLNLNKVEHLLITHSHEDHYYPEDIHLRKEPYAHIFHNKPLFVYGNSNVLIKFNYTDVEKGQNNGVIFKEIYQYKEYQIGESTVVPLLADHKHDEHCFIYLIKLMGKTLLYGHDSGYFPEDTWDFLRYIKIDGAILDCTDGPGKCVNYHMGFEAVLNVRKRLVEQNCASESTIFMISHFSHNGRLLHDELVNMTLPYGFIVAYDGMEIIV
jgi:phosphoribosyl 1,2-cyclic phosphate phosphodiesterase